MKKKGIAPEYIQKEVPGTFDMTEKKSFLGSKILNTEDFINLNDRYVSYFEDKNNQQIDLDIESNFKPTIYSISDDKENNHKIELSKKQSNRNKLSFTKWVIEISFKNVLRNYLFSNIKKYRSFEGITKDHLVGSSVDDSIFEYIDKNIIGRYNFDKIEMFLQNKPLIGNSNKFEVNFDRNILNEKNIFKNYSLQNTQQQNLILEFNQPEVSSEFTFDYYFNLYFSKF
jgi:hypothetical protein